MTSLSSINAMDDGETFRLVCWNSIFMKVPREWQAIVKESCHLLFEKKFRAVFEVKWHTAPPDQLSNLINNAKKQWMKISGSELSPCTLNKRDRTLFNDFSLESYTCAKTNALLLFLYHHGNNLYLMLQLPENYSPSLTGLQQFGCFHKHPDGTTPWKIQDFRVHIPSRFCYRTHIMKAGITTLHFEDRKTDLHLCRLTSAEIRLLDNSPENILSSLLGEVECPNVTVRSANIFSCDRKPGILKQILYRLRRKKPFLMASLRHEAEHDRLLAVIMEDIRPISTEEFSSIEKDYEIVRQ